MKYQILLTLGLTMALGNVAFGSNGKLKVFLLAGQSNMQGKALARTLDPVIADTKDNARFKHLKADGEFTVRDDVWCTFLCQIIKANPVSKPPYGPLTVGFGGFKTVKQEGGGRRPEPTIGPELGFGHIMGDYYDDQVLLIKAAWGGVSLEKGFLSPSAGGPGPKWTEMVAEYRKVLGDIKKYFPSYDGKKGYEIAGLVWFQGWNDGRRSDGKYGEELAHFIRDIRKEFGIADMPVVIGELGVDGPEAGGWIAEFRKQQQIPASMDEFKGTVKYVRTGQFWPSELLAKSDEVYKKAQAKAQVAKKAAAAEGKTLSNSSPEMQAIWKEWNEGEVGNMWRARHSDRRYHYFGSGKVYYLMGEAFGKGMIELLENVAASE